MRIADMKGMVKSTEEIELFFKLYLVYTNRSKTDWAAMAQEYNQRALDSWTASRSMHILMKTESHLQLFEKEFVKDLALSKSKQMADAAANVQASFTEPSINGILRLA